MRAILDSCFAVVHKDEGSVIHLRPVLTCKHSARLRFAYRPLESDCCLTPQPCGSRSFLLQKRESEVDSAHLSVFSFADTWHSPGWVQRRKEQGCGESNGLGGRRVCGLAAALPSGICVIFRVPVSL